MPRWIKEKDLRAILAWAMGAVATLLSCLVGLGCYLYKSDQSANKQMDVVILTQLSEIRKGQSELSSAFMERQDKLREELTKVVSAEEFDRETESAVLDGRVRGVENRVSRLETHTGIKQYKTFK